MKVRTSLKKNFFPVSGRVIFFQGAPVSTLTMLFSLGQFLLNVKYDFNVIFFRFNALYFLYSSNNVHINISSNLKRSFIMLFSFIFYATNDCVYTSEMAIESLSKGVL